MPIPLRIAYLVVVPAEKRLSCYALHMSFASRVITPQKSLSCLAG